MLQSFITQQPPLATHQQLLDYNHQPAIGIPLTNQFLSHAMNTFGCQPQSLQPPITQQTTSCQPTQQYPHNLTTRQPTTFQPQYDILPAQPTGMLATSRQPDDYYQPKISKTFRKSVPTVKPFNFDGDPEQWLDWIGTYNATIDNTNITNMSDSKKLIHLQRLVSGDAKSLIRGYGCNGSMYDSAIQRLHSEFGNTTKIVTSFLKRLDNFNSPSLRHRRSYKDLANFLRTMVDTFTTVDFQHDLHSTTNVHTVLGKLTTPCRLEWNRFTLQHHIRQPSLLDLSEWFSDYAEACTDLPAIQSAYTDDRKSASRPNFIPPRRSSEKSRSERR